MTEFKKRVIAFQLMLDMFVPYAANIQHFSETVLSRLAQGATLTEAQAARLLTHNPILIKSTLAEFKTSVLMSKDQLETMLSQERINEAILFVRNWPDSMWRIYENVLDDFSMQNNPDLQSPHDVSRQAVEAIKQAFPIYPEAEDPLRGQDKVFVEQLQKDGNPWAKYAID